MVPAPGREDLVLVAVGECDPFDARDGGVGQDLVPPSLIVQMGAEGFGLDEEARFAQEDEGVVDRVVGRLTLVFELDVLEVLGIQPRARSTGTMSVALVSCSPIP